MKAVIDTNVFLAALINRLGAPAKIYTRWLENQFTLVVSKQIEDEYFEMFHHSPKVEDGDALILLHEIALHSEYVPIAGTLRVCNDPEDDVFLETAVTANADFLVTKNVRHFPKKRYEGVRIVKVSHFLKELEKSEQ